MKYLYSFKIVGTDGKEYTGALIADNSDAAIQLLKGKMRYGELTGYLTIADESTNGILTMQEASPSEVEVDSFLGDC